MQKGKEVGEKGVEETKKQMLKRDGMGEREKAGDEDLDEFM